MKQFEIDQMTTDQIKRLDYDKPFNYKWLTLDDYLKVIPGGSQEEISKKSHKCFCPLHEIGRNHSPSLVLTYDEQSKKVMVMCQSQGGHTKGKYDFSKCTQKRLFNYLNRRFHQKGIFQQKRLMADKGEITPIKEQRKPILEPVEILKGWPTLRAANYADNINVKIEEINGFRSSNVHAQLKNQKKLDTILEEIFHCSFWKIQRKRAVHDI
jgi:hypothetical protein